MTWGSVHFQQTFIFECTIPLRNYYSITKSITNDTFGDIKYNKPNDLPLEAHLSPHDKTFCFVEKSLLTSAVNYGKALESFIPIVSVCKCNCHVTGPLSLYFMSWIEHRAGVKCGCSEQINVMMGCWFCCWFKLAATTHSFIAPSLCFTSFSQIDSCCHGQGWCLLWPDTKCLRWCTNLLLHWHALTVLLWWAWSCWC